MMKDKNTSRLTNGGRYESSSPFTKVLHGQANIEQCSPVIRDCLRCPNTISFQASKTPKRVNKNATIICLKSSSLYSLYFITPVRSLSLSLKSCNVLQKISVAKLQA